MGSYWPFLPRRADNLQAPVFRSVSEKAEHIENSEMDVPTEVCYTAAVNGDLARKLVDAKAFGHSIKPPTSPSRKLEPASQMYSVMSKIHELQNDGALTSEEVRAFMMSLR